MKNIYLFISRYDGEIEFAVIGGTKDRAWIKFEKMLVRMRLSSDLYDARRSAAEYWDLKIIEKVKII